MKKNLMFAIIPMVLVLAKSADAQEGFGIQWYYYFGLHPGEYVRATDGTENSIRLGGLGLSFGVRVFPRWVISINASFVEIPTIKDGPPIYYRGGTPDFQPEYGASLSYTLIEANPGLYILAGYSYYPNVFLTRWINLMQIGVGLVPFKWLVRIYPELSIAVPLQSHATRGFSGMMVTDYPVYIPVVLRGTIKIYIDP